jgi:nucleoside-diphosphate-sugar epimerase
MKVLVTGATGFIGLNLIQLLHSKGYSLRALCRPNSDTSALSGIPVHIYRGDILDISCVERALDGCDYVFHLAGYAKNWSKDRQIYFDVNVKGTKNVLEASQKMDIKKVIFISTAMTLGPSKESPIAEFNKRSIDFFCDYERSKFYAEDAVACYVRRGLPVVIVNPTRVFGPGLLTEGNSVTKMVLMYLKGKWRFTLADGSAIGNYAFIEDVVHGLWLALQRGQPGEKYILSGENLNMNTFFDTLANLSHKHFKMIHVPSWTVRIYAGFQASLARRFNSHPSITPDWVKVFSRDWAFSSNKAKRELGYTFTPFQDALQKTIDWLNKEYQPI